MKTLKKIIGQYMLRTAGILVVVILSIVVIIQISLENHRAVESSEGVLAQIEQFMENSWVTAPEGKEEETGKYSYLFSVIKSNSSAEYYAVGENGIVIDTTASGDLIDNLVFPIAKVASGKAFYAKINGEFFYCLFEKLGTEYVGRCARCSVMYERVPSTVVVLLISLSSIVLVLSYTVSRYMNRYVVDGINEINNELGRITEGDMDVKIDIRTSTEFSELSDYINTMVGSLSDTTSKISYVLSKTNMFIGVYEYRKGAKPVHCTEYIPRIFSMELEEWRLLTSDYELFNEYIKKVQERPFEKEAGVYILSEEPEQYVKLEEMEIGNEVFGVVIDVTEEILKRTKIEAERDVDLLTGLYNRRGLETQLSLLFRKPEQLGYSAVIMIDADGLKGINDTYGHEMGDVYLRKIGGVIRNFGIRSSLASRLGGDEYVLFLYEYDSEDELINTIRTLEYVQGNSTARLSDDLTVPLRFSMGYCLTTADMSYEELLKTADERMYANKKARKAEAAAGDTGN